MTMHLIRGISTLNTRKPKFKMTKAKEQSWKEDLIAYNKDLKRQGLSKLSWEEYVNMRLGKVTPAKPKFETLAYTPPNPRYTDQITYPSLTGVGGLCLKRESLKYTGTLVKGIATMHKSNAVPVINEEEMKDISRMRRG